MKWEKREEGEEEKEDEVVVVRLMEAVEQAALFLEANFLGRRRKRCVICESSFRNDNS